MATPNLADARWFAADLHVPDRRFGVLLLDDDRLASANFLDTRLDVRFADAAAVPVADVVARRLPRGPVGWLFHTSFCGSTLLARALHVPPYAVALKEPLVLRRLADARKSAWPLDGLVAPTVALLARPWHAGGAIVIKPTHVALGIAADLMAAAPRSRAVVLTSSLEDFLISNLKKPPESHAKIPVLAERALQGTDLRARLSPAALAPPGVLCAAGLQWAAQREHVHALAARLGARLRMLDASQLYADIPAVAAACAAWLELPAPRDAIAAHARDTAGRNAKEVAASYGPEQRGREAASIARQFRAELAHARAWLDANVLPAMHEAARAEPAAWPSASPT